VACDGAGGKDGEEHTRGFWGCLLANPLTMARPGLQAVLFRDLEKVYRKLERQKNPDKITNMMKDVSNKLKECKA
jgi:hypothetical protein